MEDVGAPPGGAQPNGYRKEQRNLSDSNQPDSPPHDSEVPPEETEEGLGEGGQGGSLPQPLDIVDLEPDEIIKGEEPESDSEDAVAPEPDPPAPKKKSKAELLELAEELCNKAGAPRKFSSTDPIGGALWGPRKESPTVFDQCELSPVPPQERDEGRRTDDERNGRNKPKPNDERNETTNRKKGQK